MFCFGCGKESPEPKWEPSNRRVVLYFEKKKKKKKEDSEEKMQLNKMQVDEVKKFFDDKKKNPEYSIKGVKVDSTKVTLEGIVDIETLCSEFNKKSKIRMAIESLEVI